MTLTSEQIRAIQQGESVRIVIPEVGEECVVPHKSLPAEATHNRSLAKSASADRSPFSSVM